MASPNSIEPQHPQEAETLSALETLRLGAAHAYYSVSRALRFDKVASLLQRAELSLNLPIAHLGEIYSPPTEEEEEARKVLSHLVHHFHSTPWMTYRSDFAPLPAGENKITLLKTDAGWGCTLRSIQMIAAQTMIRRVLGSDWRWPLEQDRDQSTTAVARSIETATNLVGKGPVPSALQPLSGEIDTDPPSELIDVLHLFWDVPDPNSPFSIHNLCYHGAEHAGVFPGRWLGPSTGCRALESAAAGAVNTNTNTSSSDVLDGLKVAVLGGTGGGAPVLGIDRYLSYFEPTSTTSIAINKKVGLLLLIPLVLGIGKLNPVYFPQLHAVLSMRQSVGIVGGRPGSSVYVVGCQGESLLYLDPHTIQPAATSEADWESYSCDVLRTLWLSTLDPSLALGFYCRNKEDYLDLCEKLRKLEEKYPRMPLVCVRQGMGEENGEQYGEGGGRDEPQDWEEDEIQEESGDNEEEEEEVRFDDQILQEVERQDSEFGEVPEIVGGGGRGGEGTLGEMMAKENGDGEEEEEMQRRIAELRQQPSKQSSVWEFV